MYFYSIFLLHICKSLHFVCMQLLYSIPTFLALGFLFNNNNNNYNNLKFINSSWGNSCEQVSLLRQQEFRDTITAKCGYNILQCIYISVHEIYIISPKINQTQIYNLTQN